MEGIRTFRTKSVLLPLAVSLGALAFLAESKAVTGWQMDSGGTYDQNATLADLDGDGTADIITAAYLESHYVWLNESGGVFHTK